MQLVHTLDLRSGVSVWLPTWYLCFRHGFLFTLCFTLFTCQYSGRSVSGHILWETFAAPWSLNWQRQRYELAATCRIWWDISDGFYLKQYLSQQPSEIQTLPGIFHHFCCLWRFERGESRFVQELAMQSSWHLVGIWLRPFSLDEAVRNWHCQAERRNTGLSQNDFLGEPRITTCRLTLSNLVISDSIESSTCWVCLVYHSVAVFVKT